MNDKPRTESCLELAEREEQIAVAQYLDWSGLLWYHVPNEAKRSYQLASSLRAQGLKAGVPDIVICEPVGRFHGLYIEMKYGKNKPSESQNLWLKRLTEKGYATAVCYSAEKAIEVINSYLKGLET